LNFLCGHHRPLIKVSAKFFDRIRATCSLISMMPGIEYRIEKALLSTLNLFFIPEKPDPSLKHNIKNYYGLLER
ncbi:MAG: hypothetical protein QF530_07320, partial [SAR202 cluster bacterium]|nr:hypothetical protein [SAR202 cluster bacterium]